MVSAAAIYIPGKKLNDTNSDVAIDNVCVGTHGLDKEDFESVLLWEDVV